MIDLSPWIIRGNALTDLDEDFPNWQQQLQDTAQKADVDELQSVLGSCTVVWSHDFSDNRKFMSEFMTAVVEFKRSTQQAPSLVTPAGDRSSSRTGNVHHLSCVAQIKSRYDMQDRKPIVKCWRI